jgi:hypothetical protein
VFDLNHVPDVLPNEAWAMMKTASDEKDIQEFREVLQPPFHIDWVAVDNMKRLFRPIQRLSLRQPIRKSQRRCLKRTSRSSSSVL